MSPRLKRCAPCSVLTPHRRRGMGAACYCRWWRQQQAHAETIRRLAQALEEVS